MLVRDLPTVVLRSPRHDQSEIYSERGDATECGRGLAYFMAYLVDKLRQDEQTRSWIGTGFHGLSLVCCAPCDSGLLLEKARKM